MKPISLLDVKQALRDGRFRESLPTELSADLAKYLKNPGCACNTPFYRKLLTTCKTQLQAYFPGRAVNIEQEIAKLAENQWTVINCHVDVLAEKLRNLPPGRKQLAITRYEDQVTVVVNDLGVIY